MLVLKKPGWKLGRREMKFASQLWIRELGLTPKLQRLTCV
jgi:hypothetical protein